MTLEERIAELEAENVALWEQMTVLADLVGGNLSLGTLVAWVNQAAATLEPVEASIKAAVSRAAVLPCCETGVRQAGHLACSYVASSHQLTHDAVHPTRGAEATNDISIVPAYQG